MKYVYAVEYCYDYEGCSLEAVYATRKLAELHPKRGDETKVTKMPILGLKRTDAAREKDK